MENTTEFNTGFCAEWFKTGFRCEEQCTVCKKGDNIPELVNFDDKRFEGAYADDELDDDEPEITECPKCKRTYDDADQDFLICSKCGYSVEDSRTDQRRVEKSKEGYGIDPDVKLDDWS